MTEDIRTLSKWLNEESTAPIDRQALARVLAIAQQAKWMPIESAPRDVPILMFGTRNMRTFIDFWGSYERINHPRISHWQPLPPAPNTKDHP